MLVLYAFGNPIVVPGYRKRPSPHRNTTVSGWTPDFGVFYPGVDRWWKKQFPAEFFDLPPGGLIFTKKYVSPAPGEVVLSYSLSITVSIGGSL